MIFCDFQTLMSLNTTVTDVFTAFNAPRCGWCIIWAATTFNFLKKGIIKLNFFKWKTERNPKKKLRKNEYLIKMIHTFASTSDALCDSSPLVSDDSIINWSNIIPSGLLGVLHFFVMKNEKKNEIRLRFINLMLL